MKLKAYNISGKRGIAMYFYKEDLINLIVPDKPDPAAAKVLQETLGGRFGEMRTMMQFFFQSNNFRGKDTQYRDLIRGVFLEEISHVELVQHTINQLLTGAGAPGPGNAGIDEAPLDEAIKHANPHHFIMGAQSSLPVDAAGNPWMGNYVYDHGNLVANLLDNLVLESTGVLQKSRIYEMSSNKTFRETLAFLIVRDNAHQNAFAKALETLGVEWGKLFPVPNYDIHTYPECKKYVDMASITPNSISGWTQRGSAKFSAAKPQAETAAVSRSFSRPMAFRFRICRSFLTSTAPEFAI
ncbi:putative manganese catalase [Paenibacillus sp. P1XP2]|nr:putative manganese catalase [Paenibacillus sp. P1XP2]